MDALTARGQCGCRFRKRVGTSELRGSKNRPKRVIKARGRGEGRPSLWERVEAREEGKVRSEIEGGVQGRENSRWRARDGGGSPPSRASAWSLPGQCVGKDSPRVGDKSRHPLMPGAGVVPYSAHLIWRNLVCFLGPPSEALFLSFLLSWEPLSPKVDAGKSSVGLIGFHTARCCPGLVRR